MVPPHFHGRGGRKMKKNKGMIVAFSLPLTLALIIMYLYPVARTVLMSFFKIESVTSSMSAWSFYGVGNYAKIFGSPTFQGSMKNMGLIWLVGGIITLFFALLFAVVLTRRGTVLKNFSVRRFICPTSSAPLRWRPCGCSMCTAMITAC